MENRAVIKSRGLGISPGYYECGPHLFLMENKGKLEPKETFLFDSPPTCCIYPATRNLNDNPGKCAIYYQRKIKRKC